MKKMLVTCAALALAATVAQSNQVLSSNIVGYTKLSAFGGTGESFTMIASPFTVVGGVGDVPIASLFSDNSIFQAGDNELVADTIKVWNGVTYVTYIFSSDAEGAWTSDQDTFTETEDAIPAGDSFWLIRRGAALPEILVAGEVVDGNVEVPVYGGGSEVFTMVGNPFAAPLPITSITAPNLQAGDNELDADTIKIWNGTTYVTYIYSSDADNAWTSDQDTFTETADTIPVGGAFWIIRRSTPTTVTLSVPY